MYYALALRLCVVFGMTLGSVWAGCVFSSDCNNRGSCVNGQCQCDPGFIPPTCQPFCQSAADCSDHGSCVNDKCQCDSGWQGERCQSQGCSLQCTHGGVPNTNTSACDKCVDCALGWTGQNCSTWDPSVLPDLEKALLDVINDHHTFLRQQASLNPLPGPSGWGLDVFSGELMKLPVVELTYTDSTKVWGGYRLPVEAIFTPYQVPAGQGSSYVFKGIADYDGLRTSMGSQNQGRQGIFAEPREDVWSETWKSAADDRSMTVVQWAYNVYDLELPTDSHTRKFNFTLSKYTRKALDMLPPYSNETKDIFQLFFANYGTSFAKTSQNGGLLEQRSHWQSWLTQQRAQSTKAGGAPEAFSLSQLQGFAQDDFYVATKQQDPTWTPKPVDPSYVAERKADAPNCYGGSDVAACGAGDFASWKNSIVQAPIPTSWTVGALDQLVADPDVSAAVKVAIDDYILQQKADWKAVNLCPLCSAGGTCSAATRDNVCSCNSHSMGRKCSACLYGWQSVAKQCATPVCTPQTCQNGGTYSCPSPWNWKCTCPAHATGTLCQTCESGWTGTNCASYTCGTLCSRNGPDVEGNPLCTGPNTCSNVCYQKTKSFPNGYTCQGHNLMTAPSGKCSSTCTYPDYMCCGGLCHNANMGMDSLSCCGTGTYVAYSSFPYSGQLCCHGSVQQLYSGFTALKCCGFGTYNPANYQCKYNPAFGNYSVEELR